MLFGLFLTLGVAVLSVALRSFQTSFSQKAGALGILIATYLAVYFITEQSDARFCGRAGLALFALAGNSYPHSRSSVAEGKTAAAQESALFGNLPDLE